MTDLSRRQILVGAAVTAAAAAAPVVAMADGPGVYKIVGVEESIDALAAAFPEPETMMGGICSPGPDGRMLPISEWGAASGFEVGKTMVVQPEPGRLELGLIRCIYDNLLPNHYHVGFVVLKEGDEGYDAPLLEMRRAEAARDEPSTALSRLALRSDMTASTDA